MLERLPLLSTEECRQVGTVVHGLRPYWTSRHDDLPSYTLGAAAYLDIPNHGIRTYLVRTVRTNRRLLMQLPWLYARLVERLSEHLNRPAAVTSQFAAPGFHIFRAHERLHELEPKLHFDLQYQRLDFPVPDAANKDHRLSFTVAINLPKAGGGLYIWDIESEDYTGKPGSSLVALSQQCSPILHEYNLGELLLHDGNHLHQIAADRPLAPEEERLTLQGHGLLTGGVWQLYW